MSLIYLVTEIRVDGSSLIKLKVKRLELMLM